MSEQIKDGGPAFPCQQDGWTRSDAFGMTLRDYFASKALSGILADLPQYMYVGLDWEKDAAECSYRLADAMLAAREKQS